MSGTLVADDPAAFGNGFECEPLILGGVPQRQFHILGTDSVAFCLNRAITHLYGITENEVDMTTPVTVYPGAVQSSKAMLPTSWVSMPTSGFGWIHQLVYG